MITKRYVCEIRCEGECRAREREGPTCFVRKNTLLAWIWYQWGACLWGHQSLCAFVDTIYQWEWKSHVCCVKEYPTFMYSISMRVKVARVLCERIPYIHGFDINESDVLLKSQRVTQFTMCNRMILIFRTNWDVRDDHTIFVFSPGTFKPMTKRSHSRLKFTGEQFWYKLLLYELVNPTIKISL